MTVALRLAGCRLPDGTLAEIDCRDVRIARIGPITRIGTSWAWKSSTPVSD